MNNQMDRRASQYMALLSLPLLLVKLTRPDPGRSPEYWEDVVGSQRH